jgi:mono/diheme cytochrome c family protein
MKLSAFIGLLVCLGACATEGTDAIQAAEVIVHDRQSFDQIERGRYLAIAGDCTACHTTPGGKPFAGGRAIETPFGSLLAPNLTPDRETGIGAWSDEDFINALQHGRGRGGERLYPAMPYNYYTKMTRDDALAIRAYLDALEPVHNDVIANQLPFPFNIRLSMIGWNALFFKDGPFTPTPGKSDEWNRGAYLVEALGHCGACHTAKNFLGGDKTSGALQGGVLQGWYSPNLTGDARTGLGDWSVEDVVTYLKSGHSRMTAATGPMAEVVADSTSQLSDTDLSAMATYLKDQASAGTASPTPVAADDRAMRAGQAIYVDNCAACHTNEGAGITTLFPTLKASPIVQAADATSLIRIVLQGAQSVATDRAPTGPSMPALGWKLSDDQVAAVITYIRNDWGNAASAISASDVKASRQKLARGGP